MRSAGSLLLEVWSCGQKHAGPLKACQVTLSTHWNRLDSQSHLSDRGHYRHGNLCDPYFSNHSFGFHCVFFFARAVSSPSEAISLFMVKLGFTPCTLLAKQTFVDLTSLCTQICPVILLATTKFPWRHHLWRVLFSDSTAIVWAFRVVFFRDPCGGRFLHRCPVTPTCCHSHPLPWTLVEPLSDLLSMNRLWPMWWHVLVRLGFTWLWLVPCSASSLRLFLAG